MSIGLGLSLAVGRGGAVGPVVLASDAFTDADGTALEAHTASDGGSWTKHAISGSASAVIANGRVRNPDAEDYYLYHHSWQPSTPDYRVACGVVLLTDNNLSQAGPAGRINPAAHTFYVFRYLTANNGWQLAKFVGGGATQLGSIVAHVLTPGRAYVAALDMRGTAISGYVDGAPVVTAVDASIAAAGRAGVRTQYAATDATGVHLDEWRVTVDG